MRTTGAANLTCPNCRAVLRYGRDNTTQRTSAVAPASQEVTEDFQAEMTAQLRIRVDARIAARVAMDTFGLIERLHRSSVNGWALERPFLIQNVRANLQARFTTQRQLFIEQLEDTDQWGFDQDLRPEMDRDPRQSLA